MRGLTSHRTKPQRRKRHSTAIHRIPAATIRIVRIEDSFAFAHIQNPIDSVSVCNHGSVVVDIANIDFAPALEFAN